MTKYKPYFGPSGPTKEQAESNTKFLGETLQKMGIDFEEDREYTKLWGGNDLNLKITHPRTKENIFVGYDRRGYVIDGDLDQEKLIVTINSIRDWLEK